MTTSNAIAYVRVSSKGQNLATQKAAIRKAAASRGDSIEVWYGEKKSARTIERPELDRLRAQARDGELAGKRLYVFKLDRLSRSGIRDTLQVIEEMRSGGCEVISVSDGFGLNGVCADVCIAVMSWAASMELQAKNERIAAARERVEAEGGSWGRPRRMNDDTVAKAVVLREAGRTIRQIAVALKVPRATVARTLASQKVRPQQAA